VLNSQGEGGLNMPYGYGRHVSAATFGHSGSQSSVGYADPESGLVVAWACNGRPGERLHQRRVREVHRAMGEDLEAVKTRGE